MESWWATRPSNDRWRPVDGKPAFVESEYGPTYRTMKSSLKEWFRSEISKLLTRVNDVRVMNEIRFFNEDLCKSQLPEDVKKGWT